MTGVGRSRAMPPRGQEILQSDLEPLHAVCRALHLELETPTLPWPGYTKVVHATGRSGRYSIYINPRHAEVKATAPEVDAWVAAGIGDPRPDDARFIRVWLDGSGPGV